MVIRSLTFWSNVFWLICAAVSFAPAAPFALLGFGVVYVVVNVSSPGLITSCVLVTWVCIKYSL